MPFSNEDEISFSVAVLIFTFFYFCEWVLLLIIVITWNDGASPPLSVIVIMYTDIQNKRNKKLCTFFFGGYSLEGML